MTDIWDNVVRDLSNEIAASVAGHCSAHAFLGKCDSPIEVAFATTLSLIATLDGLSVRWGRSPANPPPQYLMIEPQAPMGDYRVDFLVAVVDARGFLMNEAIVVECDGHAWHEKTKEQAARDKARDRLLQGQVSKVMHFTGSEIYRAPGDCAHEVIKMLGKVFHA
jgi:very-short-patch-repair endonuclease